MIKFRRNRNRKVWATAEPKINPNPPAQVPTFGPWATHPANCKCNVCK